MIKLTLYGANDKPIKTLVRYSAKWVSLKRARAVETMFKDDNADPEELLDALCALVAGEFEGEATFEEIESGARIEDLMACVGAIVMEAAKLRSGNFLKGARGVK